MNNNPAKIVAISEYRVGLEMSPEVVAAYKAETIISPDDRSGNLKSDMDDKLKNQRNSGGVMLARRP